MLRTTQPLARFAEWRVYFNSHLVNHQFKYYAHNHHIWRSSWRGRAPPLGEKCKWAGSRRTGHIGTNLSMQRAWVQRHLLQENFRKPDNAQREHVTTPDVTTMDGILPTWLPDANAELQNRVQWNLFANRYIDKQWKHAKANKARFSWLRTVGNFIQFSEIFAIYCLPSQPFFRLRVF